MSPDEAYAAGYAQAIDDAAKKCEREMGDCYEMAARGRGIRALKPTAQAVKVAAGGAPPLSPEGIDAKRPRVMALVPYADAKLYATTLREAGWPDLAGGFLRQIEAGETVASLADLDAIAAQAVKQAIPSAAAQPPPPEGISDAMVDAACAAYFGAADRPLARQREWMRQAITAALAVAAPTSPDGTSAARPAEPRANVMFDNHTFQTGSLSEVRDWIAESYDEDLRGACMLTVRWNDEGKAILQDHARHDETKVDLRNRWLAAIDRLKAEIDATPPIRETPRQKAMGLKIDVRCLRMVDDADARAMDRICRGIDELAALAEGAQG